MFHSLKNDSALLVSSVAYQRQLIEHLLALCSLEVHDIGM